MRPLTFRTYGLIAQYDITTADDLARIDELDEARWTATSVPLEQFQIDPGLLRFLDTDEDGRVRVRELQAARRWLWDMLRSREGVTEGREALVLADLDADNAQAAKVKALATHLLERLGADDKSRITLAQIRQFQKDYAATFPNGDGVVTAAQAPEDLQEMVADVIAATGGATDLSGAAGVRRADEDAWTERAAAWVAWKQRATDEAPDVVPFGDDTAARAALVDGLRAKAEQFFAQRDLLRLEPRAEERLRPTAEQLAALDVASPAAIGAWLKDSALAAPNAEGLLPLEGAVNGAYAGALAALAADVAPRALGAEGPVTALTRAEWDRITALVAPHLTWAAAEPRPLDTTSGPDGLQARLASDLPERLRAMADEDTSVADELVQFRDLERLGCYQRWLLKFANNFVSFPDLFAHDDRALFEMGTLIIDGRRVNLCVRVTNLAAHKKIAAESLMFVAYVELVRRDGAATKKELVAAAVTAGTRGGIGVGKRGVFYDRDGLEWDALVTDVIVQPISVWEAMISPFLRLRDSIAARFEKAAGDKAAASEGDLVKQADAAKPAAAPPAAPAAPTKDSGGGMVNLLMGGTVALAAAGGALALVVQTFAAVSLLDIALALGAVAVLVMAIFGLLGWLKLRRRDVATLLEATGFAINGRMRLNRYLAELFTLRPGLPKGAVRKVSAPRSRVGQVTAVLLLVILGLIIAYKLNPGVLDGLLP